MVPFLWKTVSHMIHSHLIFPLFISVNMHFFHCVCECDVAKYRLDLMMKCLVTSVDCSSVDSNPVLGVTPLYSSSSSPVGQWQWQWVQISPVAHFDDLIWVSIWSPAQYQLGCAASLDGCQIVSISCLAHKSPEIIMWHRLWPSGKNVQ